MGQSSLLFIPLRGKQLDKMAFHWGFKRKRYFYIFTETDRSLRERMVRHIKNVQKIR